MIPLTAEVYELLPARMPGFCIAKVPGVIGKVPIHHTQQPEKTRT
jgi:hypothetical protein